MSEENSVMKKTPDGRRIVVHKERTCGTKYHLQQHRLKLGSIQSKSNEKNESDVKSINFTVPDNKNSLCKSLTSGDHESNFQSNTNSVDINESTAYLNGKKLNTINGQSKAIVEQPISESNTQNMGNTNNFLRRIFNLDSITADIEAYSKEREQHRSLKKNKGPVETQAIQEIKECRMQSNAQENKDHRIQPKARMDPPAKPVKKRKRKKRNQRQRIIQSECFEPEIFFCNTTYQNQNRAEEEDYYPICPSPASTGSLTQSIFRNKDYKGACKNTFQELSSLPFNLSNNSNSTSSVKMLKTNNSLPDTSSNTIAKHEKTTITLSDNTSMYSISQQQSRSSVHISDYQSSKHSLSKLINPRNKAAGESSQIQIVDLSSDDTLVENELEKSQSVLDNFQTANDFTILEHETTTINQTQSSCTNDNNDTEITDFTRQTMLGNVPEINTHQTKKTVNANEISKESGSRSQKRPVDFAEPNEAKRVAELEKSSDISSTFYTSSGSPKDDTNLLPSSLINQSKSSPVKQKTLTSSSSSLSSSSSSVKQKILPSSSIKDKDIQSFNQHNNKSLDTYSEFTSVTRSSLQQQSMSGNSSPSLVSSNNEYLCKESKICLVKIAKVLASHYDLPVRKCVSVLKSNSYSLLTSLQDLQLLAMSSSEVAEI